MLTTHPESRFYPACPIHALLHVQCPGCGATRALTALLHGHPFDAFHANALFVCAFPGLLLYTGWFCRGLLDAKPFLWPRPHASLIWSALAVTMIFTVARNL